MTTKIKTKDELIEYLLYSQGNSIFTGKHGDEDIVSYLEPRFAEKIRKILIKV